MFPNKDQRRRNLIGRSGQKSCKKRGCCCGISARPLDLQLTKAVEVDDDIQDALKRGYVIEEVSTSDGYGNIPCLISAESAPRLLSLFYDLLRVLDSNTEEFEAVLKRDHETGLYNDAGYWAEDLSYAMLCHYLDGYEDLLLNDGRMELSVIGVPGNTEIRLDKYKRIFVFGFTEAYERVLWRYGLQRSSYLRFVASVSHKRDCSPDHASQFTDLCYLLGAFE